MMGNYVRRFRSLATMFMLLSIAFAISISQTSAQDEPEPKYNAHVPRQMVRVPGEQLKAFQVAFTEQLKIKELPDRLKDTSNYDVGFGEDAKYFYVHLIPKPDETKPKSYIVGEIPFGGTYVLRRSDYKRMWIVVGT